MSFKDFAAKELSSAHGSSAKDLPKEKVGDVPSSAQPTTEMKAEQSGAQASPKS